MTVIAPAASPMIVGTGTLTPPRSARNDGSASRTGRSRVAYCGIV